MPKVSIIIPAYNVAPWIEETLESVARQTFGDFECIIVNDCATDNTLDVATSWIKKDKRFRIICRDINGGLSAARNTGIKNAIGEYISFLDSDDMWHPDFLKRMLELIEKDDAWLAYSHFAMFMDGTNARKPLAWDNLFRTGNIWWDMLVMSEFHICSCLGKADIVRAAVSLMKVSVRWKIEISCCDCLRWCVKRIQKKSVVLMRSFSFIANDLAV